MEVQNMEQFTLYAHGDRSSYSQIQCPICIAATLSGKALDLDTALYYTFMYMPTEITDENYSEEQLAENFKRIKTVLDDIATYYPILPRDLVKEYKELSKDFYNVLRELFIYDVTGVPVNTHVYIPEGSKRNQLKYFIDKMRVSRLSNMNNKFKRYMKDYVSAYMFGFVDRLESFTSDKYVEYRMKDSDKALRINIRFN